MYSLFTNYRISFTCIQQPGNTAAAQPRPYIAPGYPVESGASDPAKSREILGRLGRRAWNPESKVHVRVGNNHSAQVLEAKSMRIALLEQSLSAGWMERNNISALVNCALSTETCITLWSLGHASVNRWQLRRIFENNGYTQPVVRCDDDSRVDRLWLLLNRVALGQHQWI